MDAEAFVDAVTGEAKTELSRLGSSKSLYADTEGNMDEAPVLSALANAVAHATKTFESWADAETGPAGDLFAAVAETTGEQYGTIAAELDGEEPTEAPPAVAESLADAETTVERVGATLGWALVTEHKIGQAVGFFVGQAAPGTASTFRDVRDALQTVIDDAADTAVDVCESDDDLDLAETAAVDAVTAAYDEYVASLEAMGVNPKPVC
jgi:hypothetical protein